MLEEDHIGITLRVEKFAALDMAACKVLGAACVVIKDGDSAKDLLQRLRDHIGLSDDRDKLYDVDFYLAYIKDLLDILTAMSSGSPTDSVRVAVQDSYEVFLYNKPKLREVLEGAREEYDRSKLRDNYWSN